MFSGLLNAFGVGGFKPLNTLIPKMPKLPGGTPIGAIGETVTSTLGGGLREGVTEGLQALTEQAGGTLLTDKGLTLKPKEALGETFIGGSAGTTIQAPLSVAQAVKNMRETVSPPLQGQQTEEEVLDTPSVAPERQQIDETMQAPVGVEETIEEVVEEPLTPQRFIEEKQDLIQQYLNEEIIPNNILTEEEIENMRGSTRNYIESHWELFNPDDPANTPERVNSLIFEQLDEAVAAQQRQIKERQVVREADKRFEAPMNPAENVWFVPGTQQPKIAQGPRAQGLASLISQGIDPVFLIKGKLIPHLQNLPNKPMSAETAMQHIGIEETKIGSDQKRGFQQLLMRG